MACDAPYGSVIAAEESFLDQTSCFGFTSVYTVPADGLYRLTLSYTNDSGLSASVLLDAGNDRHGVDIQIGGGSPGTFSGVFYLPASNLIQVKTQSCSGSGEYDLHVVVEKL